MRESLRFLWAALFRDGGEYGIWGAMSGGALWGSGLVILLVVLAHLGILH